MGNIQTLHDTDPYEITPKMDGGIYQRFKDCVSAGIGDEFTLNYSANSLNVQFNAGSQAIIGGAFFRVMQLEAVTLNANTTTYLCATIDLSRANGERGLFTQRTSSNMQTDNINGTGTTRDLLLYVITTGASGVTNVEDRRVILGDESTINGFTISVISQSDYDDLVSTDPNTLYFIYD